MKGPEPAPQELEGPVRAFIEATNAEDRPSLLEAFAEDGRLTDFGRTFAGRAAIGGWSDNENIGVHSRFRVTGVTRSAEEVIVRVDVSGDGFNGSSHFRFELGDGGIKAMTIEP